MPTYEYECTKCGHRFEEFQSIKAEPLKVCPRCQGPLKRVIGPGAGFLFKGSGFYTTDYRSSSYKEKARKEGGGGEGKPGGEGKGPSEGKSPSEGKRPSE